MRPGPIRIATRGSRQARAQAEVVAASVAAATGEPVELILIETTGDRDQHTPLHTLGGQGVFVKEVQRAVLDGRADVAVHSAKDMPAAPTDGLVIGAFTARRSPADALVGRSLADLPTGATVASGSVRRRAQLAAVRPDLSFVELRGNIDSRLSKVPPDGAIVMAVAALQILGLDERIAEVLPVDPFVPAVGQGCVAVECRAGDERTSAALTTIDDAATHRAVTTERAFLAELGSGCSLPVGAHVDGDNLLTFLADPTRDRSRVDRVVLTPGREQELARAAAVAARDAVAGDG
jgi:hydroxymethylbilane synthase